MIKTKLIKYLFFTVAFLCGLNVFSQSEKKLVREGNDLFEEENYSEAEIEYRKSLTEKPGYYKGTFNLGDAMYKQENYEESGKLFDEVAELSDDSNIKASSYYNLGNSLLSENKFKESIEAYKKSLRLNPTDADAKYNLEYARKKLNEQEQQQNQDQNKDQDKDQDKKDQDKDQDKKDQDKNKDDQDKKDQEQDKDKKDDQKDDQSKNKDNDQKKDEQQPQPQKISKQDAQRMLDALKNDEKKTLQKLQLQKAKAAKSSKTEIDW